MGYPAAYRGAAARDRAGSQKSSPSPPPRPRPSGPANDNVGPRTPANRNVPRGRSPIPQSFSPGLGSAARAGAYFARGAFRLHPALRAGMWAYDLAEWWIGADPFKVLLQQLMPGGGFAGASQHRVCTPPSYYDTDEGTGWGPVVPGSFSDKCVTMQSPTRTVKEVAQDAQADANATGENRLFAEGLWGHAFFGAWRFATTTWYSVAPNAGVTGDPAPGLMLAPYYTAPYWPSVTPGNLPINNPAPHPQPVPYPLIPHRRPDPWAPPGHRWVRGPGRRPAPGPDLFPNQLPAIVTTITITPDGKIDRHHEPKGTHDRGEKEKKFRSRTVGAFVNIARAIGQAGEVGDLIEVAHDSLPEEFQADSDRIFDKGQAVFRHTDQMDWQEFWWNYAGNDLEDRAIGSVIGGPHGRKIGQAFHGL